MGRAKNDHKSSRSRALVIDQIFAQHRIKWLILALAALTIMGSYYTFDSIAPVAGLLRDQRGFSQSQIGLLNAVFNLPNIALALIGGILIDRIGAAKAILIAAVIWH